MPQTSTDNTKPASPLWQNWSQNLFYQGDNYYYTPRTRAELQAIVTTAAAQNKQLRVSGQRHSQTPLVASSETPASGVVILDLSCYADLGREGDQRMQISSDGKSVTVNTGVREDELDAFLTQNKLMLETVTAGGFFSLGGMTAGCAWCDRAGTYLCRDRERLCHHGAQRHRQYHRRQHTQGGCMVTTAICPRVAGQPGYRDCRYHQRLAAPVCELPDCGHYRLCMGKRRQFWRWPVCPAGLQIQGRNLLQPLCADRHQQLHGSMVECRKRLRCSPCDRTHDRCLPARTKK
jgi:hypothetical protein